MTSNTNVSNYVYLLHITLSVVNVCKYVSLLFYFQQQFECWIFSKKMEDEVFFDSFGQLNVDSFVCFV